MIAAVWRGQRPLWELFWLWYLAGSAAVVAACLVGAFFLLVSIEPSVLPYFAILLGPVLAIPYQILVVVGVVRGALRAESPWRFPAIGIVFVLQMLAPLVVLFAPFVKW